MIHLILFVFQEIAYLLIKHLQRGIQISQRGIKAQGRNCTAENINKEK
jgi:hypothetical protein